MIVISLGGIDIDSVRNVVFNEEKIEIADKVLDKVAESFEFLNRFSENKVIYGINTGLGPMAQYKVDPSDYKSLQYNLIRSHSCGAGEVLPDIYIRSILLARLVSLLKGYSGVDSKLVLLIKDMINSNIYPLVFEHGGVGASGDLIQLAHIALSLLGEGEVSYEGKCISSKEAFEKCGLEPLEIKIREGLALLNGTSAMTGIGIINAINARNLLEWSVFASSALIEIVESYDDHFSDELNVLKNHSGQITIAQKMRELLEGSRLVQNRFDQEVSHDEATNRFREKVQEYYSIRCVPQILGPVLDTLINTESILIEEINSVNDNPIIDKENNNVYHGGNFHGDYVSFEMDKLKIAITKLSMLCERQLNYLLNNKLNEKLTPFINLGVLGLNLGLQGLQFTATSTTAENQTLSNPMYIHSIPSNLDNQDIVSMGTNSALLTKKVIENSFQVITIEIIAILQAIDFLNFNKKLSPKVNVIYKELREVFPLIESDEPRYKEIDKLKNYLQNRRLNLI